MISNSNATQQAHPAKQTRTATKSKELPRYLRSNFHQDFHMIVLVVYQGLETLFLDLIQLDFPRYH